MTTPRTVIEAASPKVPTSAASTTIPSGAAVGTAIAFTSGDFGRFVTFHGTSAYRLRAGATSGVTATAGDYPRKADTDYPFQIVDGRHHVSVYGDAAGTLYWAKG